MNALGSGTLTSGSCIANNSRGMNKGLTDDSAESLTYTCRSASVSFSWLTELPFFHEPSMVPINMNTNSATEDVKRNISLAVLTDTPTRGCIIITFSRRWLSTHGTCSQTQFTSSCR